MWISSEGIPFRADGGEALQEADSSPVSLLASAFHPNRDVRLCIYAAPIAETVNFPISFASMQILGVVVT